MSDHRILVLEHQHLAVHKLMELLSREGARGDVILLNGEATPIRSDCTVQIPVHFEMQEEVIVEYKFKRDLPSKPVFTGPRRSKGERKRNKANRWS